MSPKVDIEASLAGLEARKMNPKASKASKKSPLTLILKELFKHVGSLLFAIKETCYFSKPAVHCSPNLS